MAAQLLKANDVIDSDTINETNDGWENLDLKFGDEEGALLGINLNNQRLGMSLNYIRQVHVNNLAAFEVLVVKVADDEGRFSNCRKELLFDDLSVVTVTVDLVYLLLFEVFFFLLKALFLHGTHYLLRFSVHFIEIRVGLITS